MYHPSSLEGGRGGGVKNLKKEIFILVQGQRIFKKKLKLHNPSIKNIFRITSLKLPSYKNKLMLADV